MYKILTLVNKDRESIKPAFETTSPDDIVSPQADDVDHRHNTQESQERPPTEPASLNDTAVSASNPSFSYLS
jgi:hypothetical protein